MIDWWGLFFRPMHPLALPYLLVQAAAPVIWLGCAAFCLQRYRARGLWSAAAFPLAIFGWNVGGLASLVLMACVGAPEC